MNRAPRCLAALLLAVAACGDDATAPERLDELAFEARVDEVCSEYGDRFDEILDDMDIMEPDLAAEGEEVHSAIVRAARDLIHELRTFEPREGAAAWHRAIDQLDRGFDEVALREPPDIESDDIVRGRTTLTDRFGAGGCFA